MRYKSFLVKLTILVFGLIVMTVYMPSLPERSKKQGLQTNTDLNQYLFSQKKQRRESGQPKTDRPDAAALMEMALRSEVGRPFSYSGNWRFQAWEKAKKLPVSNKTSNNSSLQWTERGPGNVGGRTRSILIHPQDSNRWLAGAVGGGIWLTTDAGSTWQPVSDELPVLSITCLAQCQNQPDIVYAGTGEGFSNYDAIIGDGIFKSTDGGNSWSQLPATAGNSNFKYVNRLIVDPAQPNTVLAATNNGVFRSVNGGDNWTQTFSNGNRVQQILANPNRFNTQFITVNAAGIYRSTNGGQSFTKVSEEISGHYRIEMAAAPTDTTILYAAAENGSGGLQGIYRSADGGKGWTNYGNSTNWLGGQGWYDNAITVSPLNKNVVFVGGINIYKATFTGAAFSYAQISMWYGGTSLPYVHADQHCLTTILSGDNFALLAGNDGGVHYSANQGVSWEEKNSGYNVTQYYDGDRHPYTPKFIGGTQDNGTHVSPSFPDKYSFWTESIGGDGFDCAWNKFNELVLYGTLYDNRIYKSEDGGLSFSSINNNMPESSIFHTPLAMNAYDSDKLYSATDGNVFYHTANGGQSWSAVDVNYSGSYPRLAPSLANGDIIWVGAANIFVSENGGASFTYRASPRPGYVVTGISSHPTEDSTAFLTFGVSGLDKIYRTTDLGQTWQNITGNLPNVPVHTVLVMPFDKTEIWAGTDIGLFISNNEGQTWTYANDNLPAASIRRLKIVGQDVVAVTHGRGIWSVYREEIEEPVMPFLAAILDEPGLPNLQTGNLPISFYTRNSYDSVQVWVNGNRFTTLTALTAFTDYQVFYPLTLPQNVTISLKCFGNGQFSDSDTETKYYFEPAENIINAEIQESLFSGSISQQTYSGFSGTMLHTPHFYADNYNYLANLMQPLIIKPGSKLQYRDVAIVEPGEPGKYYPSAEMWDYVTVEGSLDGQNWQILLTPYDCRANATWQSTYDAAGAGTEAMMVSHETNLTTYYSIDDQVYLRFRLFADEAVHGWGWTIDDIKAGNNLTTVEDSPATPGKFELLANYPNPFNPSTTIRFTLPETAPVTLQIYDNLGKLVKEIYNRELLPAKALYQVTWDGTNQNNIPVASGVYFSRLESGNKRAIRKLTLIR